MLPEGEKGPLTLSAGCSWDVLLAPPPPGSIPLAPSSYSTMPSCPSSPEPSPGVIPVTPHSRAHAPLSPYLDPCQNDVQVASEWSLGAFTPVYGSPNLGPTPSPTDFAAEIDLSTAPATLCAACKCKMGQTSSRLPAAKGPFPCALCGKAFKRKGDLVRHSQRHTNPSRFICPELRCPRHHLGHGFPRRDKFVGHLTKRHGYSRPHADEISRGAGGQRDHPRERPLSVG